MTHAEKLMERILLLDGTPNMSDYFKINIGQTVKAQLENDLNLEYEAVKRLNGGIQTCVKAGDNGSRELLEKILKDEEHHVDWLEGQVHAIGEMGIENYLAQQLHKNEEE
jgi:bacterioferritin